MEKKKRKDPLKEYDGVGWFLTISCLVVSLFLVIGLGGGSISDVCNVFIRQETLAWFGMLAFIWLICEMLFYTSKVAWNHGKSYWIAFVVILYGFLAFFATEWNWSVFLLPLAVVLRLFMPYSWVKEFQKLFPLDDDL